MVRAPGNQCGIQKALPELRLQSTCEQERKMRSGYPHWGRQGGEGAWNWMLLSVPSECSLSDLLAELTSSQTPLSWSPDHEVQDPQSIPAVKWLDSPVSGSTSSSTYSAQLLTPYWKQLLSQGWAGILPQRCSASEKLLEQGFRGHIRNRPIAPRNAARGFPSLDPLLGTCILLNHLNFLVPNKAQECFRPRASHNSPAMQAAATFQTDKLLYLKTSSFRKEKETWNILSAWCCSAVKRKDASCRHHWCPPQRTRREHSWPSENHAF